MKNKGAVGAGGRFAALKQSIEVRNKSGPKKPAIAAKRPGGGKIRNPDALAAAIGRAKWGNQKMGEMAAAGRRRA